MDNIREKFIPLLKDALVLFVITIFAGVLLAFTYDTTKNRIQEVMHEHTLHAYEQVLPAAASFENYTEDLSYNLGEYNASLDTVVRGKDKNGNVCGFVVTTSALGYGGMIKVVVGIDMSETVMGIAFPETLSETPGLGQKVTTEDFYSQFAGKKVDRFKLVKSDASEEGEIAAVSGATKSSTAVVEAVNLAKVVAKRAIRGGAR